MITVICSHCGKETRKKTAKVTGNKTGYFYCNNSCRFAELKILRVDHKKKYKTLFGLNTNEIDLEGIVQEMMTPNEIRRIDLLDAIKVKYPQYVSDGLDMGLKQFITRNISLYGYLVRTSGRKNPKYIVPELSTKVPKRAGKSRGLLKLLSCSNCGKEFLRASNDIRETKSGLHFCTFSCYTHSSFHREQKIKRWDDVIIKKMVRE